MEKYFDLKTILSIVVAFVVIILLTTLYKKATANSGASDSITAAQYAALSTEDKAKYSANTDGSYSKKAA